VRHFYQLCNSQPLQLCEYSLERFRLNCRLNASFGLARLRQRNRLERSLQLCPFIVIPFPRYLINFATLCALFHHRFALRDGVLRAQLATAFRSPIFSFKRPPPFFWLWSHSLCPLLCDGGKKSTKSTDITQLTAFRTTFINILVEAVVECFRQLSKDMWWLL
jgi:hypothetical protein